MGYTMIVAMVGGDEEERAHLIAVRAKRLLADEDAQWEEYCRPGCAYCALELAREQLDEEQGWSTTAESRDTSEVAMRTAVALLRDTGVHERAL
jgi:hypothetical protein